MKKQADPLSKEGIVGAFCRTYSIEEAIRLFLSDVYQESMVPERFDYIPADSQAGVVIYEGKFAYSHHATDPACGKLLNAFDIVRIHKFGEQDDKTDEDTDAGKLPSFKATDFDVDARVGANTQTSGSGSGGTVITYTGPLVSVAQMVVRSEDDIRKVSQGLYNLMQSGTRAQGIILIT